MVTAAGLTPIGMAFYGLLATALVYWMTHGEVRMRPALQNARGAIRNGQWSLSQSAPQIRQSAAGNTLRQRVTICQEFF